MYILCCIFDTRVDMTLVNKDYYYISQKSLNNMIYLHEVYNPVLLPDIVCVKLQ